MIDLLSAGTNRRSHSSMIVDSSRKVVVVVTSSKLGDAQGIIQVRQSPSDMLWGRHHNWLLSFLPLQQISVLITRFSRRPP